ncbi:MAG: response regulator transcription factor [Dehalobacter sp.]|nr:response regulator transcription factor [Dehalobacter sp.]
MSNSNYRVLLVDDHRMLLDGLELLLAGYPEYEVVGEALSGEKALALLTILNPDIVVIDLALPGISGLEVIQDIRKQAYTCKIIVLTMHNDKDMISEILKAGADGFVPKSAAHTHLLEAFHTIVTGGRYLHPGSAFSMFEEFSNSYEKKLRLKDLSERELEVLTLTALGYSRSDISGNLNISPKTVDTYRQRSMEKLNLNSRAELVQFALLVGIMQNEDQRL